MKIVFSILFSFFFLYCFSQKTYLLVGTYTSGKSKGVYVYDFNSSDGSVKILDSAETINPSYLAVSPDQKYVYAVNETSKGHVSAFSFNSATGHLNFINTQPSMGDDPCYVSVDKNEKWLIVANYSSGSAAVLPINKDGSLGEAVSVIQHYGHGTNLSRQQSPHVHSVVLSPNGKHLFVQDLGKDKIIIYSLHNKSGKLEATDSVQLKDGAGPRHLIFHPSGKWAYLIQEMSGDVTVFDYRKGHLQEIQTISSLPKNFNQFFTSADIHISNDGNFLYTSARDSSNTIAVFKVDPITGKLNLLAQQSALGKTPRNFNLDPYGKFLLVANQNSNDVVIFKVDSKTGLLSDTGKRISVGNPVCIKWIQR